MEIEQNIQQAIIDAIGIQRFEMWFVKNATIAVHDFCVKIRAINAFAADWIRKNFLTEIRKVCLKFLGEKRTIEIVSPETEIIKNEPLKNETINTKNKSTEKISSPKTNSAHKIPISPVVQQVVDEKKVNCNQNNNKKEIRVKKVSAASDYTNQFAAGNLFREISPQQANEKIITQGRKKLSEIIPPKNSEKKVFAQRTQGELFSVPESSEKNVPAKSVRSSKKLSQELPTVKRDAANRNVVTINETQPKKSRGNNTAFADSEMSFGNFVTGASNRLAVHAAELAVQHTGKISPIYLFGPTSVGKSHLLQAIKSCLRRDPQAKMPLLMTAEQFTSAFIDGLKQGMPLFRNKFRGISALLIDDIQFFAGKDSTQTEFLRTLDQLKSQGIQIVLTGDRSVAALSDILKPEIVSRIEAGMPCEMKPAEQATLLKIFQQMAASRNLKLPDDVCQFVVSHLTVHARQLSGAVNRIHAAVLSTGRPVTLKSAETILEDLIRNNNRPIRLQDIDKAVCETFQLSNQTLQSKSRAKQAVQPRMLAMWLARKYTRSALSEIGKYFGNRSHSTVVSAQKKIDIWLQSTPEIGFTDSSLPITDVIQKIEYLLQTR